MTPQLAVFDPSSMGPRQSMSHAHIGQGKVTLHDHDPSEEPAKAGGIVIGLADWYRIMDAAYWKREETITAQDVEEVNLLEAETHVGYVVLRFKKGKKKAEEEVSILSLRQADARIRRRHR